MLDHTLREAFHFYSIIRDNVVFLQQAIIGLLWLIL